MVSSLVMKLVSKVVLGCQPGYSLMTAEAESVGGPLTVEAGPDGE